MTTAAPPFARTVPVWARVGQVVVVYWRDADGSIVPVTVRPPVALLRDPSSAGHDDARPT